MVKKSGPVRGVVSSAPTLGKKHVLVTDGQRNHCLSKSGGFGAERSPAILRLTERVAPLIHRGVVYQGFSEGRRFAFG